MNKTDTLSALRETVSQVSCRVWAHLGLSQLNLPIILFQISKSFSLLIQHIWPVILIISVKQWCFLVHLIFHHGPYIYGLQWTLLFRVRSDKSWGLQSINYRSHGTWRSFVNTQVSFVDTRRSFTNRVSHAVHTVQLPCWFQFNAHAQYTLCNIFRYILPFSKSCPNILKILPEYLAQT